MIRLQNVNKYFNKRKSNEIHVINDTSLELPEKGIVAMLGPSGCGKTTLLNAIGGLDKINSGKIFIDDACITKSRSNKIDNMRNAKIGYIFQNFNLLDEKTVFENVEIALRMIGIKDKNTIKERVNYCLDAVGIYKYRNKTTDALSGGQRQRVAIARAIVKNPRIIIADEPTGNLDSLNTLEIMNIIKTISKDRLVLLVTHEKKIAEFYSDRIIELKDGCIVEDYQNDSSKYLDYQLENRIFLKDMNVSKKFADKDLNVDVYSDKDENASIKMVIRGGNIYINTLGQYNVVDETSNIEMIDDHYSAMDSSIYEENKFQYDKYLPENHKRKYSSIYTLFNMIGKGFKSLGAQKKLKKLLLIGFVFAAMFTFLATSNILGIFNTETKDFLTTNKNYVTVSNTGHSEQLLNKMNSTEGAEYAIPGNSKVNLKLSVNDLIQTTTAKTDLEGSLTGLSTIDKKSLYAGRMPENNHEILIDKMLTDKFIFEKTGKNVGLTKTKQFIDKKVTVPNMGDYTIVGVTDTDSPSIYVNDGQMMNILTNPSAPSSSGEADTSANQQSSGIVVTSESDMQATQGGQEGSDSQSGGILDYNNKISALKIKSGRAPKSNYEVLVNNSHVEEYELGKNIDRKINNHSLKLVGFYTSDRVEDNYYVNSETIKQNYIGQQKKISIYAKDPEKLVASLKKQNINATINYDQELLKYKESRRESSRTALILAGIILLIALIEMFLMLRSSFISRIKEVGTMRAIGLKKKDIYKMFLGEIISITLVTSIPGIVFMYYILYNIVKIGSFFEGMYLVTPMVAVLSFVIMMIFNIIVGMIPVIKTVRKSPAEILSRTDI